MSLEPELVEAVEKIVSKEKQPAAVAKRLIAWLEEASLAEVTREDQSRYLDSLRNSLNLGGTNNED